MLKLYYYYKKFKNQQDELRIRERRLGLESKQSKEKLVEKAK